VFSWEGKTSLKPVAVEYLIKALHMAHYKLKLKIFKLVYIIFKLPPLSLQNGGKVGVAPHTNN